MNVRNLSYLDDAIRFLRLGGSRADGDATYIIRSYIIRIACAALIMHLCSPYHALLYSRFTGADDTGNMTGQREEQYVKSRYKR